MVWSLWIRTATPGRERGRCSGVDVLGNPSLSRSSAKDIDAPRSHGGHGGSTDSFAGTAEALWVKSTPAEYMPIDGFGCAVDHKLTYPMSVPRSVQSPCPP